MTRSRQAQIRSLFVTIVLFSWSCSEDTDGHDSSSLKHRNGQIDSRPSIVLMVVESLRTDAVSSYGRDRTSPFPNDGKKATPNIDALAERGIRYDWAIAASPETVASHASIFTGLRADQHGVGLWANPVASESLTMVAESLRSAGYQTAGFVENPMAGPQFGFDQGFDSFAALTLERVNVNANNRRDPGDDFGIVDRVRGWMAQRDLTRPYFLFINLADPHLPLKAKSDSQFMPEGVSAIRIDNLLAGVDLRDRICQKLPDPGALEILGALYRSEVEEADRKIGELVRLTERGGASPILIVTADHGTHFGERRLLGHQFAVDNRVLRVPLVIAGVPGEVGFVETPVAQRHLASSIRCWSGDQEACAEALPTTNSQTSESIISIFGDERAMLPTAGVVDSGSINGVSNHARVSCAPEEELRGRAISLIRWPMKMIWREAAPPRLYDLSWDPAERSDQAEHQLEISRKMRTEIEAFVVANRLDRVHREPMEGSLRERAVAVYNAAMRSLLAAERTEIDAVWFAQIVERMQPDPDLAEWINAQIRLHVADSFYPMIAPDAHPTARVDRDPGRGIAKWITYLRSAVADPDAIAMRHLADYLAMDATGYILTHQLSALEWARAANRPLARSDLARLPVLLQEIAAEHEKDSIFSDLWVERAAFMTAFGNPDPESIRDWVGVLVEHHLGSGDWGDGATMLHFDGESKVGYQQREHARGMAMIVLARYLTEERDFP